MEKKQKIILFSLISIILIIVIIVIIFNLLNKKPVVNNANNNQEENNTSIPGKPITQIQNERNILINTARGFTEVYGTYTNTNDYQNIKELSPFMTDKMVSKFNSAIESYKRSENYYSKVTQVLSVNVANYKNGDLKTNAIVSVVEKVVDSTMKETISKRNYNLSLIKDADNKWKVDEIK